MPGNVNKWALIIGRGGVGAFNTSCDLDAKNMARVLAQGYSFPKAQTRLLLNDNATHDSVVEGIHWLKAGTNAQSTVVFFYSGHGGAIPDVPPLDEPSGLDSGLDLHNSIILDDELRALFLDLNPAKFLLAFAGCGSGGMVADLVGPNRIALSSVGPADLDYSMKTGTPLGLAFVKKGLGELGLSVEKAYAYYKTQWGGNGIIIDQYPGGDMTL